MTKFLKPCVFLSWPKANLSEASFPCLARYVAVPCPRNHCCLSNCQKAWFFLDRARWTKGTFSNAWSVESGTYSWGVLGHLSIYWYARCIKLVCASQSQVKMLFTQPPDPHFTHNLSCHVQKPMEPLSSWAHVSLSHTSLSTGQTEKSRPTSSTGTSSSSSTVDVTVTGLAPSLCEIQRKEAKPSTARAAPCLGSHRTPDHTRICCEDMREPLLYTKSGAALTQAHAAGTYRIYCNLICTHPCRPKAKAQTLAPATTPVG